MDAQKARSLSLIRQHEIILDEISKGIRCFAINKYYFYPHDSVYPEVAEMLASNGYNVETCLRSEKNSYTVVILRDRQLDKKGSITIFDERIQDIEELYNYDKANSGQASAFDGLQLYNVERNILQEVSKGQKKLHLYIPLHANVVETLVNRGYDIRVCTSFPPIEISWENAKPGEARTGTVTAVKEAYWPPYDDNTLRDMIREYHS
jgi:hypothetical protein